jgi:hypothetical protein
MEVPMGEKRISLFYSKDFSSESQNDILKPSDGFKAKKHNLKSVFSFSFFLMRFPLKFSE